MSESAESESSIVAGLLQRWSQGDKEALDQLLTHLYRDIHAIAVRELRHERQLTIRPTALVNEAYMRLAGLNQMQWRDRAHFLSMAARVTRQALVDEARQRRAGKRDGGEPVTLSDENLGSADAPYDALDVDALLTELETFDKVAAEVVSLRIFGGLSIEEAAEALGISVATVNRRWATGKAWLTRELMRNV
jgi:RNA polymerase sigma factor (TIGR02999 family)